MTATLEAEALLADAERLTGLSAYGEPDPRESLQALVHALNEEANLTPEGAAGKRLGLIRVLANRLMLQEALRREPAIARERIHSPIVILGLPRSGTTKLHRMIAADPVMQKLPLWRLLYPVGVPGAPSSDTGVDSRIKAAEQFVEAVRTRSPEAYAAHPMLALEPDEEYFAMELSFLSHINTSSFNTPSYEAWLASQPFDAWYAWLDKLLKYVQHDEGGAGRPWVLKAPHHLGYLPLLFARFPDATVVHCHRDPAVTVSSFCALLRASRRSTSTRDDPAAVGQYAMRSYGTRMQAYLRDRAVLKARHRFVDVSYATIVRDAPRVIAQCYAAAGLPLSQSSLAAMQAWQAGNEQHKHGQHRYELADFGLTQADVESVFGDYAAQYARYLD